MTLLNAWVLFALIPIYFIYKKHTAEQSSKQTKMLYLALIFMLFAMARPAYENAYVNENFDSRDYIIALDASYSMQAQDLHPNRYTLAKNAIKKLILEHPKDRFTIFAFTSQTLLISPPTTDTAISLLALDALNPEYILTKSTNLKNLFKSIAKLKQKQKNLIIFSDGGDEHDIVGLTQIAKQSSIIPYIVATATQKGAALKKSDKYIKDAHEAIVISKINPMLIDLANATGGRYYQLKTLHDINTLSADLEVEKTLQETIEIKTYKELFYIPLSIALVLFFLSVTKVIQHLLLFIPLLFMFTPHAKAGVLDFYHLKEAKKLYKEKKYKQAAWKFEELAPSTHSYYNIALSYYKAGKYRDALHYFTQIKTKDRALKQKIYYNIGNCAAKIKKYDEAKRYYIYALALGEDADALYNLNLLRKMGLKTFHDITEIMPRHQTNKKKKTALQGSKEKKQNSNSNKKGSNQSSNQQSNGSGTGKKKRASKPNATIKKEQKGTYKFSYKAYEKINKGYTDEKEPW